MGKSPFRVVAVAVAADSARDASAANPGSVPFVLWAWRVVRGGEEVSGAVLVALALLVKGEDETLREEKSPTKSAPSFREVIN